MRRFMLAAIALMAASGAWAAEPGKTDGKAVYLKSCASCHGKDAKGNPAMAKMFKVDAAALNLTRKDCQAKPDADLVKVISEGKGKMPAYKGKLSPAEIDAVTAYLRALAPKLEKK